MNFSSKDIGGIVLLVVIVLLFLVTLLSGCATYTGRNDMYIQWPDQPEKSFWIHPRTQYFSAKPTKEPQTE